MSDFIHFNWFVRHKLSGLFNQKHPLFMLKKQLNLYQTLGGQFQPESGGQFVPELWGSVSPGFRGSICVDFPHILNPIYLYAQSRTN